MDFSTAASLRKQYPNAGRPTTILKSIGRTRLQLICCGNLYIVFIPANSNHLFFFASAIPLVEKQQKGKYQLKSGP